ncbi:MAG TPA: (Fe-S)-binding protein, partial [Gemmatimonadales bacterium]|nr:(Fe-S)-binding protein [Gemmatimonadales bacterium]
LPGALAGGSRLGFTMGMLAAAGRADGQAGRWADGQPGNGPGPSARPPARQTVALFEGCVMSTLFRRVNEATARVLEANGYRVVRPEGQTCCGALHDHAGDTVRARRLLGANIAALDGAADFVAVNSAGCGAILKDADHLVGTAGAARMAAGTRDVSELLVMAGPRQGAPVPLVVAYDAPCHLQHAQRVRDEPLRVLRTIPGLDVRLLAGSDRCCGSAGIFSLLNPAMSRAVLDDKIRSVQAADPSPALVVTGNPGCLMQIGAGLRAAGLDVGVAHPVELLDESYRLAGFYR